MRLDHGLAGQADLPRVASPTVVVVGSPPWEAEQDDRDTAAPRSSREWNNARYGRGQQQQQQGESSHRVVEQEKDEYHYTLFCGGEGSDEGELQQCSEPYSPPLFPWESASTSSVPAKTCTSRSSNGCGAIIHMRAAHRKRMSVWTAKTGASDAVVGMDPMYFDSAAVAKIVRSACGCVREGVGCAVW